jgi:hypothetical protein
MIQHLRNWNGLAPVGFIGFTLMLGGFGLIVGAQYPNTNLFADSLNGVMQIATIFAHLLWFGMGCGVIVTCVRVTRFVIKNLRQKITGNPIPVSHFGFARDSNACRICFWHLHAQSRVDC